jgi:hypothetical protein
MPSSCLASSSADELITRHAAVAKRLVAARKQQKRLAALAATPSAATAATAAAAATPARLLKLHLQLYANRNEQCVYYGALCSYLYRRTLHWFPILTRKWWRHECSRAASKVVSTLTATHYSPLIIEEEMLTSHRASKELKLQDFEVVLHEARREIIARYTREEAAMSVLLTLPPSYPLLPCTVDFAEEVKVKSARLRRWKLTMSSILGFQNSSIADALRVWKQSVDKEFEGIEECPICYSIVQDSTKALPQISCPTCHKAYHSACVYRWFNTSGKSTCPMCREVM